MNKKHLFIMILCCLIPIAGLAAIRLFNLPVTGGAYFALMLLCPVSHVILMKFMMGGNDHHKAEHIAEKAGESCRSEPAGKPASREI